MVDQVLSYVVQCINVPFAWFNNILVSVGGVELYLSILAFFLFFRLILLPLVRGNIILPSNRSFREYGRSLTSQGYSKDYYGDVYN